MHVDNTEIINKEAYEIEISHIFRYTLMLFKNISEYRNVKKLPEQINMSIFATCDKSDKQN